MRKVVHITYQLADDEKTELIEGYITDLCTAFDAEIVGKQSAHRQGNWIIKVPTNTFDVVMQELQEQRFVATVMKKMPEALE